MEEKTDELNSLKIKNSSSAKDTIKKTKRQARYWGKIFAKPTFDKGLVCKIY